LGLITLSRGDLASTSSSWITKPKISRSAVLLVAAAAICGCVHVDRDNRMGAACAIGDDVEHARARRLRADVEALALDLGERSYRAPQRLEQAAAWVERRFHEVREQLPSGRATLDPCSYTISEKQQRQVHARAGCGTCPNDPEILQLSGSRFRNVALTVPGARPEAGSVVVGAHFDSDSFESRGCNPGADDNASGVAAMLELARMIAARVGERPLDRSVVFVGFTNEEEPFFHTDAMGSRVYAAHQRPRNVIAMLSLETLGYYSEARGSQDVPPLVSAPDTGNFVAFVGNVRSAALLERALVVFRGAVLFPAHGIRAPEILPGIGWSDHWSFWREGIPALMITDTAPNRNRCYHRACDTPDRLDYERLARVVTGLEAVIEELANVERRS
jgi:hypothetical protein